MIMYAYRAFLDRVHLSNNWILEICVSLLLGKPEVVIGQKNPNPNTAVIHNSDTWGYESEEIMRTRQ